jgi:ABC-type dipeptide/oligopeptide/nickel transport system permease subunit
MVSVLAPVLAPYDPLAIDPMGALQPPSFEHPMGTDPIGRDVLSRVLFGGRISLVVGLVSVGISLAIGVILGLLAGYFGGTVDNVIMRLMDMMLAFAGILLALTIVAVLGPGLTNVMLAVGISGIPNFARLVRGSVLSAKENLYVEAARSIGIRSGRIIFRHILPNVMAPVIVLATLAYGWAILSAASLSFLGLGAQPPTPEWGIMLSDGRGYLREAPWVTFFPGFAIMLTVLSANVLGDGLRDALDPRQRN